MKQQNECRLSGQIDRVRKITTKTGAAMCEVILTVRGDHFRVVSFGNLAEYILAHAVAGDELAVTGSLSISNWKDEATGEWRNSFAVTAWGIELHGEAVAYQKKQQPKSQKKQRWQPPVAQPGDYF